MTCLPSASVMQRAFAAKDAAFDGTFVVAVKTTGVFCRPVCRAKPAKPENCSFFATAAEALREGYRPCKLCKPLDPAGAAPAVVGRLLQLVDQIDAGRLADRDLSGLGIDPSTARRQFKRYCGMTFAAYQRARRLGGAAREVQSGVTVALAQAGAGYESASGFSEAFKRLIGAPPAQAAAGVSLLVTRVLPTPLGPMLAAASDEGLVLLEFDDGRAANALDRLCQTGKPKGPKLVAAPGDHPLLDQLAAELSEYFAGTRREFHVPLVVGGTDFEHRAWEYLRTIPYGQTRSYGQQAQAIGLPKAVRAVGGANGRNVLAIIIPCHRVIGANGTLTGYGGGMARKRWLLNHELSDSGKANDSRRSQPSLWS